MRATIISIFSLAAAVSAAGNAIVINNSLEPLYLWTESDEISEQHTVAPSKSSFTTQPPTSTHSPKPILTSM